MKLTCDEATTICDKNQYGEATLWEKTKRSIHVFLCKKCGLYSKQNSIMTKCYEKHKNCDNTKNHYLDKEEKSCMDKEVKAKI
jgi:hypothetical protein